jgi:hemerythrin-like domain-containing protein
MENPMHRAIRKLRDEHRSISAVLSGLRELARLAQEPGVRPDFAALRAMVYYIDAFPERLHHPKEDEHLFARLVARAPETGPLVRALQAEHVEGARLVRELERAVLGYEQSWPQGGAAFRDAVDAYAEFHWRHMRKEEQELLPIAEQRLGAEDWAAVEKAFRANEDPLADAAEHDLQRLFRRIVEIAPAPVGLGASWRPVE